MSLALIDALIIGIASFLDLSQIPLSRDCTLKDILQAVYTSEYDCRLIYFLTESIKLIDFFMRSEVCSAVNRIINKQAEKEDYKLAPQRYSDYLHSLS